MSEEGKTKNVPQVSPQTFSPAELIQSAISKGSDLEDLEKLLSLRERWEANEARKAYHKAMAAFKANPPKIDKDKKVSFATSSGKTSYSHASLANVTEKINTELSKYGLSASWTTKQNGAITVTCRITHELGHGEETTLTAQSDVSGSKNAIQAIGSTITYLERYTLLALTGLATCDMDDDAQSVQEYITEAEALVIMDNIVDLKIDAKKLLSIAHADSIEKILKKDYQNILMVIKQYRERKEKQVSK